MNNSKAKSYVFFSKRPQSLRKSRNILKWVNAWYQKKSDQLSSADLLTLETEMASLDQALLQGQKEKASEIAQRLEKFANTRCKKSIFEYLWELAIALGLALIIAVIIRMMWFEPYEIPTGSMRPTFREQDHLLVTKTAFGLNMPMETKHFYFDPSLVQRTSVVIFSGDGLPLGDTDSTYFGIFPYKKRYIKRLIGKPGDSFYFYGGRLYGVDREGNDLTEVRDSNWMQSLEYVPFLSFEGEVSQTKDGSVILKQMHRLAGRLSFTLMGQNGEVYNGKEWIKDQPLAQTKPHDKIETYSDLYGIRNYAVARLLTKDELKQQLSAEEIEDGLLYLQLHHTPSLSYPRALINRSLGLQGYSTYIPLQKRHLDAIMDNLYTARFVVANGRSRRYALGEHLSFDGPQFKDVPDGTYEFYNGKASKIRWGGIPEDVSKNSPLYSHDAANVQKLFNYGIEMNIAYNPSRHNKTLFPHRYAYFRDGDLYLMGSLIVKKDDPVLINFNNKERQHQESSSPVDQYVAFRDYGPPIKNGNIDVDFIRTFGITVPDNHYFVLGDNHAMSSDSRVFGFVPQQNLQGAPLWIVWPPGDRVGAPPQKAYPFMNLPRAIVWSVVAVIALLWYLYHRWKIKRPIFSRKG